MKPYAFGVDAGGPAIQIGLFQTTGHLVEKWTIPTRIEDHGSNILPDIVASIREKVEQRSLSWDCIEGVGMGVPGPVTEDGTVLRCVNLGWDVFNIPQKVQELEPRIEKLRVANDVNAATLGEMWQGGAQWNGSAVMVTLGPGIGSGIVVNNRIFEGCSGAAGEIGHMCVNPQETRRCTCGNYGCLEQYCSTSGLIQSAKALLEQHPGDPSLLGQALAAVACIINPQVIVIGGELSSGGEVLLKPIEDYFRKYAFHVFRNTEFVLAELGDEAGMYGSARMLFDEVKLEEEEEF